MIKHSGKAIETAKKLVNKYKTRNPYRLAEELGIIILEQPFKKQKGMYKVIERNRFIFVKEDLHPVMKSIVLLHELGHDQLHRKEAMQIGGFSEFNLFQMEDIRTEYEANIFAANVSLADEEILDLVYQGYDVASVAKILNSDINLVALKIADLRTMGHNFREQEFSADFLK